MNPSTKAIKPNYSLRLLAAGLCSLLLWFVEDGLSGGVAHDVRKALLLGSFSIAAIVLLLPVVIRGDWVQRILAFALLLVPLLGLVTVFCITYELR
jgi:hypothetical protein